MKKRKPQITQIFFSCFPCILTLYLNRLTGKIIDLPEMRDKQRVFANRPEAGLVLANMLKAYKNSSALVMAVPAGGVPVALSIGQTLNIAVPTAHMESLQRVSPQVDAIYCPNVRSGYFFAVADAYKKWYDIGEEELFEMIREKES